MRPELFRLFQVGFPSYFVLLLTGFLFATAICAIGARRTGQNPDVMVDLGLAMLLAGVAGGRILHVFADGFFWDYVHLCTNPSLVNWPVTPAECTSVAYDGIWDAAKNVCHPKSVDCFAWAKFWAGGLAYYGGFIGASLAAWFLLKRDRFPFWKAADLAGVGVPLGLAFGRMGCLLAGCCFGSECDLPWAISFPPRSPASEQQFKAHVLGSMSAWSHPVHPTQIYESAASLGIAAVCLFLVQPRKRYDGQVFAAFLALYAVARFALEVLRRDDRGGMLGLSTSQLIGVALVLAAAAIHVVPAEARGRSGFSAAVPSPGWTDSRVEPPATMGRSYCSTGRSSRRRSAPGCGSRSKRLARATGGSPASTSSSSETMPRARSTPGTRRKRRTRSACGADFIGSRPRRRRPTFSPSFAA